MSKSKNRGPRITKSLQRRRARRLKRKQVLEIESLEQRMVLATNPFLQAVAVDDGSLLANIENTAPRQMTLRFDADQIISTQASSLGGITLVHGGQDRQLGTADDVTVVPGFRGRGDMPNEVVLRFAETLPDNIYQLQITGQGATPLRNTEGDVFDADPNQDGLQDFQRVFRLDLGAQVLSVVPQPTVRNADGSISQRLDQVVVYFNNDPLDEASAESPEFYQLRYTGHTNEFDGTFDSVTDTDDVVHFPLLVDYDPLTNRAVLTFASNLDELDNDLPGIDRLDGTGTYRLQVGIDPAVPLNNVPDRFTPTADPGDHFATAQELGDIFARGIVVSSAIDPRVDPLPYPGAIDEPGHRDVPGESHFVLRDFAADFNPGATTILYNFKDIYGQDPNGNDLQNLITENQKELARQIIDIYSYYGGVQFVETEDLGFTIVTGDMRAVDPNVTTGAGGVVFIVQGDFQNGIIVMDAAENWSDEFATQGSATQESWFESAMAGTAFLLGIDSTDDLAGLTVTGSDPSQNGANVEPIFPGDHDITHLRYLHRPESNDVDLYRFELPSPGVTTIESFAERLDNSSLLDSHLTLWRETGSGRVQIASNDDYFGEDSFIELSLDAGTYYVGVSSTGNTEYNPLLPNSGAGGTSEGDYQVRITHRADLAPAQQIRDRVDSLHPSSQFTPATSQPLDGDADGVAGGAFNFWFRVTRPEDTIIVDKAGGGDFTEIDLAMAAASAGDVVRIVGNGGADGNLATVNDNLPYVVGRDVFGSVLADGTRIDVKKGVTLMIDEGAVLKFRNSAIIAGSTSSGVDRSGAAVQVLGTPDHNVYLGSFQDDSLGGDSDGLSTVPRAGDWGGLLFTGVSDQNAGRFNYEDQSIFLNSVNFARMSNAGGSVSIESVSQVVAPLEMRNVRLTATFNTIIDSADAAIGATPDSFAETNFHAPEYQDVAFTSDYTRVGPAIYGNTLLDNSFNGLFIRVDTPAGGQLRSMTVSGRWDDTDIPHVLTQNLQIQGQAGNGLLDEANVLPTPEEGVLIARPDARLRIDPGVVVKLDDAIIEVGLGAQLIAEGTDGKEVVFTSLFDDRFGGSGTFDTTSDAATSRANPGDWGGIYLGFVSSGSIDRALITFAGGSVPLGGSFAAFNPIEVHQADLRLTNSRLVNNAGGTGGQAPASRFGRTSNASAAIFIRQAQPIIVDNVIEGTVSLGTEPAAAAISINASALNWERVVDGGRSTGLSERKGGDVNNQGPLLRGNRIGGNDANGMEVRGATLTTESVWDDTDIVHLLFEEINVPNFHTYGGLRLESSPTQSLVVKLSGDTAGFTATGRELDIDERIGGAVQIVGHPNFPVVLTSVFDNSVGAGLTPDGQPQLRVFENSIRGAAAGDWRSVRIDPFSNDRNLDTIVEYEATDINFGNPDNPRDNGFTDNAQFIGSLAPNEKSGDDNLRLGFDIHGTLGSTTDQDVYSFLGQGGTEVWLDMDQTTNDLDSVVELITADGFVLARSVSSKNEAAPFNNTDPERPNVNARNLSKSGYYTTDHYSINARDPGMRVVLPETGVSTYYVRVRGNNNVSDGSYQLQLRLNEVDEVPGSTVKFADIRYATNGVELFGVPAHSPLLGEAAEAVGSDALNNDFENAQLIGNVLDSDRAAITIAGLLSSATDVDWYQFDVQYEVSASNYASVTLDLDYADGASRPNASIAIYNDVGDLVAYGNNSNLSDDRSAPAEGADVDDLTRGSFGTGDALIGPLSLRTGTYHVAVFSDANIPREMSNQFLDVVQPEEVHRFLPNDAVTRIAVDRGDGTGPLLSGAVPLTLNEVKVFISTENSNLLTANAYTGAAEYNVGNFGTQVGDFAMREDGRLFSLSLGDSDETSGNALEIDTETGMLVPDFEVDDGIATYFRNEEDPENPMNEEADVGIQFNALTFGAFTPFDPMVPDVGAYDSFWGVGDRGDAEDGPTGPAYVDNILYKFNRDTFVAEPGDPVREPEEDAVLPMAGAFTQIFERGRINTRAGGGPGGLVTGIAFIGTSMFAVSDAGGLFRIDNPDVDGPDLGAGISTTYVSNVGMGGIPFSGLAAGPIGTENGIYSSILFGIDSNGGLHAFDTNGALQPIFADGASSVQTGYAGANGIAFSTYQENLWHILDGASSDRFGDAGHGIVVPVTDIPDGGTQGPPNSLDSVQSEGGASFYFGSSATQPGTRNGDVLGNYDFPGGARGSLLSNPFDLSNYDSADEPYVYFNYLLETQGDNGLGARSMSDSFRVYLLDSAGTYHLLATNNSDRSTTNSEYANDPTQNPDGYGRVQELFDYLDESHLHDDDYVAPEFWRQARIPLREFAGQNNLQLRFDFSTEGGLNDPNLPADSFGNYTGNTATGVLDNAHEGVYVDDLIIGFAERGEVVTGSHRTAGDFERPVPTIVNNPAVRPSQILQGDYQLEIRRSLEYNTQQVMDTNDRLTQGYSIVARPASQLQRGDFFILSNGLRSFTFEFLEAGQLPSIPGAISVPYQPGASQRAVSESLVNAINVAGKQAGLEITAGFVRGAANVIDLHGEVVILENPGRLATFAQWDDVGDTNRIREQGQVVISSNYIRDAAEYGIRTEAGVRDATAGSNPRMGPTINFIEANSEQLAPGATLVNNVVVRSGQGGILVAGDVLDGVAAPTPFARVINNTIVGAVDGSAVGVGIEVRDNVSPTLLNNILDSLETGISVDASSSTTVVGGSLFHNVTDVSVAGDFAILLNPEDPLFVDPTSDNFFPAELSRAIDSSVSSLDDRAALTNVRGPLGIAPSPVFAPLRDASGQLRVDDPEVDNSTGQGSDVFVDRGALDRSDFTGPNASLIGPRDNDSAGLDLDTSKNNVTIIEDSKNPLRQFVIQLVDGGGADTSLGGFGVDDTSVVSNSVLLLRDEIALVEGVDYSFEYDSTNNQIRLVPATGVWTTGSYRVELLPPIRDLFGNPLLPNRTDGSTQFNIVVSSAIFDFGDAPAPYPTALADDGARHSFQADFFLGAGIDTEPDARVMETTDDGIALNGEIVPGSTASITVTSSKSGRVDAWVDFNGDGDWMDSGEQILSSRNVVGGANEITFAVPNDAVPGTTYARFRLSANGGLSPFGLAGGGEVEDYEFTIQTPGTDFGDAPGPYPTLLADDGARHEVSPGFFLGQGVTGEADGKPSAAADADADDGVVFTSSLAIARSATVDVTSSGAGLLDAWIDFNGDGDWNDAGEQIFSSTPLVAGVNGLSFDVPVGSTADNTFARFRLSSTGGLSVLGAAVDGEVEDYRVTISETPLDFGDAPDPFYPTLLANDGARHAIVPGIQLGATIDSESDGQPSAMAEGDQLDEDGVVLGGLAVGRTASVTVAASVAGFLDAWIDFNADGDWTDAGEQVFASTALVAGSNQLTLEVPEDALATSTYARFRFSTAGGLAPTGKADDGEVEDYFVDIVTGSGWHNFNLPADVDNNGVVAPLDALTVINELNNRELSDPVTGALPSPAAPPFLDVNNDGFASPLDAILVINQLPSSSPVAALAASAGGMFGEDAFPQLSRPTVVRAPDGRVELASGRDESVALNGRETRFGGRYATLVRGPRQADPAEEQRDAFFGLYE